MERPTISEVELLRIPEQFRDHVNTLFNGTRTGQISAIRRLCRRKAHAAIPFLLRYFEYKNHPFRGILVKELGKLPVEKVRKTLEKAVLDTNEVYDVRLNSAIALGVIGHSDSIGVLTEVQNKDLHVNVQEAARKAILKIVDKKGEIDAFLSEHGENIARDLDKKLGAILRRK